MKLLINLVLKESDKNDLENIFPIFIDSKKSERNTALIDVLKNGRTTINSSEILRLAAPSDSYDFFISHSHDDIKSVLLLASYLRNMGFKVFVDSEYWLYFDDISKELNENHLHGGSDGKSFYDHNKTKEIQKNCDVMLSASLLKIMTKSKILIFVNTPSSLVSVEKISKYNEKGATYSPWIFYEILVANALFEKKNNHNFLEHYTRDSMPQIVYDEVDMNNMVKKTWIDFKKIEWNKVINKLND